MPRCLNVPTRPLIYQTFVLPLDITLPPTHYFNFAGDRKKGDFPVPDRLMLSDIAMEHVLASISFLLP